MEFCGGTHGHVKVAKGQQRGTLFTEKRNKRIQDQTNKSMEVFVQAGKPDTRPGIKCQKFVQRFSVGKKKISVSTRPQNLDTSATNFGIFHSQLDPTESHDHRCTRKKISSRCAYTASEAMLWP